MPMDLNDLNNVWEVKPLKMTGEKEARKILENVAEQVEPIMRKHKWRVRSLSEFCPSDPSNMGSNIERGAEIKLRLRRPEIKWDFFPFEQILDTMLHELCHNEHGPHNVDFYKLLDEIRLECEELKAKGTKDPEKEFDLSGRQMGGSSQPPPLPSFHQNALAASERKAIGGTLLPSRPKNIGGDNSIKVNLSPVQAAARAAARRRRDELWCGTQSLGSYAQETSNAASSSMEPRNRTSLQPQPPYGRIESQETWQHISSLQPQPSYGRIDSQEAWQPISSIQAQPLHGKMESLKTWQCANCTLINKPLALVCEACQTPRIKEDRPSLRNWPCKFCTLINDSELERCSACGECKFCTPARRCEACETPRIKKDAPILRSWSCKFCTLLNGSELERCSACGECKFCTPALPCEACQPPRIEEDAPSLSSWSCKFCTLLNNNGLERCSACGECKFCIPAHPCEACQPPRIEEDIPSLRSWSCKFCTLINDSAQGICSACEKSRYS